MNRSILISLLLLLLLLLLTTSIAYPTTEVNRTLMTSRNFRNRTHRFIPGFTSLIT
ncbi:hypothetical protein F2Q70_00030639 [Brassica cretica]|uniref:Uncharacterized protein n=1 Tax=Brassica cretica TaxID=69181 RepID=A0A8S9FII4_BRACR|nr:hypothetical protein F2Q70_00030639 [Brassica cretica]KAF2549794.1 hypothetical protein F2Q68_00035068 [Brassica cretica]